MKRYDFHCDGFDNFDMRESEDGEYVLFDDVEQSMATAQADADRLAKALKKIADGDYDPLAEWHQDIARAALTAHEEEKNG